MRSPFAGRTLRRRSLVTLSSSSPFSV
uniref:Uncharacterized protein n=1 Tax=Arundo donax TaxID=35708 RepID=A0A0A9C9Q2_ARUDO